MAPSQDSTYEAPVTMTSQPNLAKHMRKQVSHEQESCSCEQHTELDCQKFQISELLDTYYEIMIKLHEK